MGVLSKRVSLEPDWEDVLVAHGWKPVLQFKYSHRGRRREVFITKLEPEFPKQYEKFAVEAWVWGSFERRYVKDVCKALWAAEMLDKM